jgi:acyl-CoA dehydrogenase
MDGESVNLLLDAVRRYVREKLVPLEAEVAESECVPESVLADFRQMGLYGLTVPERYGGLGLSAAQEVEAVIELTWASVAFRSAVGINLGVGTQCLAMDGTEEQKREWLPKLAAGAVSSFALTEPGSGSDSAALMTRAVRDGEDYVLNGTKRFITNAPVADLITVMARTHPERLPKNAHISAFLVPAKTPGLRIGPKDRKMGQAGALSADVYLEDVRVPARNLLGGVEGRGFITAMKVLDRGRLNVSAMCVGQARRILNEALTYSSQRIQFGKPIGEFQLVQAMLADSRAELYAAECMLKDAARRYDIGERISLEASCCKMYASEMAGRVADRAVQIHGGAGYMRDTPVERFYRDVRLFRIYEGTTQIQQLVIARELLRNGLD